MAIHRGSTSRGGHIRALALALATIIDFMDEVPSPRRVALRNTLAALRRAYPELDNEVDLAQYLEEQDGIPQEDGP